MPGIWPRPRRRADRLAILRSAVGKGRQGAERRLQQLRGVTVNANAADGSEAAGSELRVPDPRLTRARDRLGLPADARRVHCRRNLSDFVWVTSGIVTE